MSEWNPWHGCTKISAGCLNCYVYRTDGKYGKDSSIVTKTASFSLPLKKTRGGDFKLTANDGVVFTCFTSDFLHEAADEWRAEAWKMMKLRSDLEFLFITKRIHRLEECLPPDWGKGYPNVTICCTCENQDRVDFRLPIYLSLPLRHRIIICEPLLERIDLSPYLSDRVEQVVVGGESGENARLCDYDWILGIRRQCMEANVSFAFRQTGAFFRKDGKLYRIPRRLQHSQARKANINL